MGEPVGPALSQTWQVGQAREAVKLIRRKCADFHLGPGHSRIAPLRGRIYDCNRYIAHQTPPTGLRWGAVHI